MRTEDLIAQLAHDARPVRPLPEPRTRALLWLASSAVYVGMVIVLMAADPARLLAIGAPSFWLEQAAACATALAAAVAALASVVPGRSRRVRLLPVAPLLVWIATLAWGCLRDVGASGAAGLKVHPDWPCIVAMLVGMAVPAFLMVAMLRRGAPLAPGATGAFAALAGAALSSVAACLSRPVPHPTATTVLVWHFGTLLTMVAIGAWTGVRVLGWRGRSL